MIIRCLVLGFFPGRQIDKDSSLLHWGKSPVTPLTFLIHGWAQLICYIIFLITDLLRQATRANGSIWISRGWALPPRQRGWSGGRCAARAALRAHPGALHSILLSLLIQTEWGWKTSPGGTRSNVSGGV